MAGVPREPQALSPDNSRVYLSFAQAGRYGPVTYYHLEEYICARGRHVTEHFNELIIRDQCYAIIIGEIQSTDLQIHI